MRHTKTSTGVVAVDDKLDPIKAFLAVFSISSFAGLAALLRSGRKLDARAVASSMLNSGLLGLGIGFLWWKYYSGEQNVWFLFGVSLLAGLGGTTMVDFAVQVMRGRLTDMLGGRSGIDKKKDDEP